MSTDYEYKDKLSFLAEWFDYDAAFHKNFLLNFYPSDNTVELFDRDANRMYLRRATCEGIQLKDMFVGNFVRLYGRQIKILDYADCKTKQFIGKTKEHTFAIIKPSAYDQLGEVLTAIQEKQFQISRLRSMVLTRKEALKFYENKKGDAFLPFKIEHLVSGPIVAMELVGDNAIERWRKVMGPTNPSEARSADPESLRAIYGKETASNGFHGAENYEEAVQEACYFFPQGVQRKPPQIPTVLKNSTCCIIKPHAIDEGKLGLIISEIMKNNFKITGMLMVYLTNPNADEFLEVYKGVVVDYRQLLASFLDGPCVAMEICGTEEDMDVQAEFRRLCGPHDSDIARQIRPYTLRGQFGVDKYRNAVHCTDLPEDTVLELEYFFKIMDDVS